ncbi:MAG: carotenoid oxygenase family protein, partial [Proteobacteria bacterium]|nr:carotenoid oxygenase family protein [Pseudomonadota bacterium]
MQANRYLTENYGPVAEEVTTTNLRVTGEIPRELNGRYLRNGPNPLGPIDAAKHHGFSGHGMVHGVRLGNGRAQWYRNRWVRSPAIIEALGEDLAGRELGGANNTHVIGHAGRTWALVEAGGPPIELSDELDTLGVNTF